jgi:four helix bundle protein
MKRFKDLIVYQKSKELVIFVYKMLDLFPDAEKFALCSQMRRAVVSVPSNIAEGMGRLSDKDQAHFLNMSYGSLMEVYAQADIAHDLKYIDDEMFNQLEEQVDSISKMIQSMCYIRKNPSPNRLVAQSPNRPQI